MAERPVDAEFGVGLPFNPDDGIGLLFGTTGVMTLSPGSSPRFP